MITLAHEWNIEITPEDRLIDICRKIKSDPDLDEESIEDILGVIVQEREIVEAREAEERAYELAREAERKAYELAREAEDRAYELAKKERARVREVERRAYELAREAEDGAYELAKVERALELEKLKITKL